MKQITTMGIMLLSLCAIKTNAQNYQWATGGNSNTAGIKPKKSTMDPMGNSIMVGQYSTMVDMNFSSAAADTAMLYPKSIGGVGACVFITKYKEDGNFAWAKRLFDFQNNRALDVKDVATDATGNVYVAGSYIGWCDFNPSDAAADTVIKYSTKQGSTYYQSMYVAKYDTAGNFVWVMNLNGGVSALYDLNIKNDRLYITGETRTTTYVQKDTDFDPSELPADTAFVNGTTVNNTFFAAYDLNGKLKTVKRLYSDYAFRGYEIDADTQKNIYLVGNLTSKHDLNPSVAVADTAFLMGAGGAFLAKYDSAGVYKWAIALLENNNYAFSDNNIMLKALTNSDVYVSGYFSGTVDFNPGTGAADTFNLNSGTATSSYLLHYNTSGVYKGAFSLGNTTNTTQIFALGSDDSNYLYIAGDYAGKIDFNLQHGVADTSFRTSAGALGNADVFFAKYKNDTLTWSRKIGNAEIQNVRGMGVNNKRFTIFGNYGGDVIFDPMPPANLASQLLGDGTYLASYRSFPPSSAKQLITYAFTTPAATGTITADDSVFVTVPFGTTVTNLVATFTVSPLAVANVGSTLQVSGTTPNDFTGVVKYTIVAEDSSTRDYFVKVKIADPVGINELNDADNSFKVWPNPASSVLNFEYETDVQLYDINGRIVLTATKTRQLSIANLAAGVYILENEKGQKRRVSVY